MIYFARHDDGAIKIGHSANVPARIKQLEKHYARPLAVLATMEGDRETEAALHERFAHLRLGRTEQFRPALELLEFIDRPLLVSPNPGAVEAMSSASRSRTLIAYKGLPEFGEWMAHLARDSGLSVTAMMDRALLEFAERRGFPVPMPDRCER